MSFSTRFRTNAARLLALSALAFTAACADSLTAPTPEVSRSNGLLSSALQGLNGTVNGLVNAKALLRNRPITQDLSKSVLIRNTTGGVIEIFELGLRVEVPAGALPRDTMTITVTPQLGRMIAYDFQPHGTQFRKPLVFRQNLTATSWDAPFFVGTLSGGYFKANTQLNPLRNTALLDEVIGALVIGPNVTFPVHHFSGYMVSSGRASVSDDEAAF